MKEIEIRINSIIIESGEKVRALLIDYFDPPDIDELNWIKVTHPYKLQLLVALQVNCLLFGVP